jgi:hypothetical protein
MKPDIRDLYDRIGKLFYAIARERGVTLIEVGELKRLVGDFWLPMNGRTQRPVITSEGHKILLAIDNCQMEDLSSQDAFIYFKDFFTSYPEIFSAELRKIILETVTEITGVFPSGNSSASRDHLTELRGLLYPLHYGDVNIG